MNYVFEKNRPLSLEIERMEKDLAFKSEFFLSKD